jgi:hypothetical protein
MYSKLQKIYDCVLSHLRFIFSEPENNVGTTNLFLGIKCTQKKKKLKCFSACVCILIQFLPAFRYLIFLYFNASFENNFLTQEDGLSIKNYVLLNKLLTFYPF